jgi:large subunit ribosomal protein L32e
MEKRRQGNFQRTKFYAYVKLGLRQKSMRTYRRATGRHNKTRQKWRSRPPMVEIGYKNRKQTRGMINGKMPVLVSNLADLSKVGKENIIILAKIGMKNKIAIAKEASAKKMEIYNLNVSKFLKESGKSTKFNKANTVKKEEKK